MLIGLVCTACAALHTPYGMILNGCPTSNPLNVGTGGMEIYGRADLFLGGITQDSADGSAPDVKLAGDLRFGDTCAM